MSPHSEYISRLFTGMYKMALAENQLQLECVSEHYLQLIIQTFSMIAFNMLFGKKPNGCLYSRETVVVAKMFLV